MQTAKSALCVIDMQQGLFRKKIPIFREVELLQKVNSLIDHFHAIGEPVLFIRHTNANLLVEGSEDWQLHPELHVQSGDLFLNKSHSSAFKEKHIKAELAQREIQHLVIVGLVTHGCVKAACQDAHKLGYEVVLVQDGHSSYHANADLLIAEWNEKLAGEGIKVIPTEEIVKSL